MYVANMYTHDNSTPIENVHCLIKGAKGGSLIHFLLCDTYQVSMSHSTRVITHNPYSILHYFMVI